MADERNDEPKKGHDSLRSYVSDYMANWRSFDGPLVEKMALVARNRAKAYTVGRGCCGHPGEPGC